MKKIFSTIVQDGQELDLVPQDEIKKLEATRVNQKKEKQSKLLKLKLKEFLDAEFAKDERERIAHETGDLAVLEEIEAEEDREIMKILRIDEEKEEEFDVQTILSTYTNTDNHPGIIVEKIKTKK